MTGLTKLLAGAALALCLAGPALAGTPVTLKSEITAQGRVTLGDLFENAGAAAKIAVAAAPPAGGSVMLDAATVQRLAAANGLSWINERGIRRVIIREAAPAAEAPSPEKATSAKAETKGVDVLTWTRVINAGDLITAEDLTWSTLTAGPAGAPRDPEALIGKVAKRPLRSGAAAATRDVGAPLVVKKDDMVTVAFNAGGVSLSMQAKALGPAAAGDSITLMNTQSKKTIQALVTGPGRAVVGPEADAIRAANPQTLALR